MVEVAITLTVMAVLVALMAPSMTEWVRGTHVRTIAESAQAGLQKARMEALKRNKVVTFWLVTPAAAAVLDDSCAVASNSGSWVISEEDPAGQCAIAPSVSVSPRIVETRGAGANAAAIAVAGLARDAATPASSVSFNGLGQTVASATSLAILDITHTQTGARRLRVTISSAGAIRMCDRDVAAGGPTAC